MGQHMRDLTTAAIPHHSASARGNHREHISASVRGDHREHI